MRHLIYTASVLLLVLFSSGPEVHAQDRLVDLAAQQTINGQTIAAPSDAPAEVFLADASEFLMSPGSALRIDRYVYDPVTGRGSLEVTVLSGTVRIAGGTLNDETAVVIRARGAELRLDQGAALVEVGSAGVRTHLSYGRSLKVSAAGATREIMRPEFQVRVPDGFQPTSPETMSAEQLALDFGAFSGARAPATEAGVGAGTQIASVDPGDLNDRAPGTAGAITGPGTTPGANFGGFSDGLSGSSSGSTPPVNPPAAAPSVLGGGSTGFSSIQNELEGLDSNSWVQRRQDQLDDDQSGEIQPTIVTYETVAAVDAEFLAAANAQTRDIGPTTNKLFDGPGLTFSNAEASLTPPQSQNADLGGLVYFWGRDRFITTEDFLFGLNGTTTLNFIRDSPEPLDQSLELPAAPARELEATFIFNLGSQTDEPVITSPGLYRAGSSDTDIIDGVPTPVVRPASFDDRTRVQGLNFGTLFGSERALDNFLYLELIDNTSSERLVFAAGDVDRAGSPNNFTPLALDQFFISPGLTPAQRSVAEGAALPENGSDLAAGQRAFLRAESWTALDEDADLQELIDSGLFVINPASRAEVAQVFPATAWTAQALHADFGIAGDPTTQRSTISATIGTVRYRDNNQLGDVDALTSAFTIGSSRTGDAASTSFYGPVFSTAAGGGNPRLDANGDGSPDEGRMGFLVLENAGFVFDDVVDGSGGQPSRSLEGGTERAVGSADTQRYALARLAQGTSSRTLSDRDDPIAHEGYAAAFVEQPGETGIGIDVFSAFGGQPNLIRSAPDDDTNTFMATLSRGEEQESFQIGGPETSAYADNHLFGALSSDLDDHRLALVSGDMAVSSGASPGTFNLGALEISFADPQAVEPGYRHLEWGFFFGDLAAAVEAGHVHMGTFATGAPVSIADLAGSQGEATYRGHAIGNVINDGVRYTAAGTYAETFVFGGGAGSGRTVLDFDRTQYDGVSALSDGRYSSAVANAANTREGRLTGSFVGPVGGPGATPQGVVGRFQLQNSSGTDGVYRATGTFGGEQN